MINFNSSPKNEEPGSNTDGGQTANPQPDAADSRSRQKNRSWGSARKSTSLFRSTSKPASQGSGQTGQSNGIVTDQKPTPPAEKVATANQPVNPGQRLRLLESAGKDPAPDLYQQEVTSAPARTAPAGQKNKPGLFHLIPKGESTRKAYWDIGAGLSLLMNIILLVIILILAAQVSSLRKNVNNLLAGMFNNFVRMDNSVISTTINMTDVQVPINFNLPVTQPETNVTLTRAVTIQSARVSIVSGALTINNAPATVTLPQGTVLPVSLQMEIPVQTTVSLNLQVPVNIKLSEASSADPNIGNLHTAFVGLQDTIGPLYCQFDPQAQDYLNNVLCDEQGIFIKR